MGPGSAPPRTRHTTVLQWMTCLFVQDGLAKDRFVSPSPLHVRFIDRVRLSLMCIFTHYYNVQNHCSEPLFRVQE